jgi:hypothetical protein
MATLGDIATSQLHKRLLELGIIGEGKKTTFDSVPSVPDPIANNLPKQELIEAQQNQKFYLEQVKVTSKPWHHNPRKALQYSEFVLITPAMAKVLEEYNVSNRPKSKKDIDAMARDMKTGRYLQTGESIQIDLYGNMFDGQHRCSAIIKANIPYPVYVTFNVPPEARLVVDSGRKRPAKQKLEFIFGSHKLGNKLVAICRAMMEGTSRNINKYSESEVTEFMLKHENALKWLADSLPGNTRSDVQAVICKAGMYYGFDKMSPFCKQIMDTSFSKGDPARALYKYLQNLKTKGRTGTTPVIVYKKTLYAVDAFIKGKKNCNKLMEKQSDIFEWEEGWELPKSLFS